MLQSINPNTVPGTVAASVPEVAASALELADGQAGTVFDLQLPGEELPAELLTLPEVATQTPAAAPEVDAELWLSSMMAQQAVQLQARESVEPVVLPQTPLTARTVQPQQAPELSLEQGAPAQLPVPQPAVLPQQAVLSSPDSASATVQPPVTGALASVAQGLNPVLQEQAHSERLSQLGTPAEAASASVPGDTEQVRTANAPQTLKLHESQARWGEQMLHSLRESVDMQVNQRIQNATIRLDPPELGSLEIFLSHEAGRLTVQLSAANADVARLLQLTSDRLRQELVAQNFVQVNVQVSADAQGGRQHANNPFQSLHGDEPVLAAREQDEHPSDTQQDSASDVLVTV